MLANEATYVVREMFAAEGRRFQPGQLVEADELAALHPSDQFIRTLIARDLIVPVHPLEDDPRDQAVWDNRTVPADAAYRWTEGAQLIEQSFTAGQHVTGADLIAANIGSVPAVEFFLSNGWLRPADGHPSGHGRPWALHSPATAWN